MHNTIDIYEGGKNQAKEYHRIFNHEYFVGWMRKLLDALKKQNIENNIIIMDNAKYHKYLPYDTPLMGWKNEKLLDECSKRGIQVPDKSIKTEIWKFMEPFIRKTLPIICEMEKSEWQDVLLYPPKYSNLQPIEIVWAYNKGEVGWKYTTQKTFKDFLVRLKESFTHLNSQKIKGYINQANQHLKDPHQHILDIKDKDEEKYSNKDVYKSNNDGKGNINDDSGDGEANNKQQGDQQQGDKLG